MSFIGWGAYPNTYSKHCGHLLVGHAVMEEYVTDGERRNN